jgi:hypothetical protein
MTQLFRDALVDKQQSPGWPPYGELFAQVFEVEIHPKGLQISPASATVDG